MQRLVRRRTGWRLGARSCGREIRRVRVRVRGWEGERGDKEAKEAKRLFVFGASGYVGSALVRRLRRDLRARRGDDDDDGGGGGDGGSMNGGGNADVWVAVDGTSRSGGDGLHAFDAGAVGAAPTSEMLASLARATHVMSTIPPVLGCCEDEALSVITRVRQECGAAPPEWLGYLSTTSVYGNDLGGVFVDEESTPEPSTPSAARRLEMEVLWRARKGGMPAAHIFRLGGVYGPGRSLLDAVRLEATSDGRGAPSPSAARRRLAMYTARVHVEDVVTTLLLSMASPSAGSVYNVVDDDPAPRVVAEAFARQLAGIDEDRASRPSQQLLSSSSKRVRNTKIKDALGVHLAFPSFRSGLMSILREEDRA